MNKEDMILSTYMLLKDCLEEDDDFEKMHDLIEQMSVLDADKAFDMWYPLLSKYENFITERHVNETYNFVNQNLDTLGEALGYSKFDEMILQDNYLYDLLIKKYCYSINHYNYTQKMLIRIMAADRIDLEDKIFADAYSNGNNAESWFEIIDGFIGDIKYNDFIPSIKAISLLSKWAGKVEGKKDKAKIMSIMLATGLDFDFTELQQSEYKHKEKKVKKQFAVDDPTYFCEIVNKYPEVKTDRQKLKALLSDFYPNNKLFTNIVLMVFDEGMIPDIGNLKETDLLKRQRLIARLVNNYGISEELADLAIETWIKGLN